MTARTRAMLGVLLAVAGLCLGGQARAFVGAYLELVDNSAAAADPYWVPGTITFDFKIEVTGESWWDWADVDVWVRKGQWYDHPFGADWPMDPALYPFFPALEFDSFYCSPDEDLSDGAYAPEFLLPPGGIAPCRKWAGWSAYTIPGPGEFTIARYSFTPSGPWNPEFDVVWDGAIGFYDPVYGYVSYPIYFGPLQPPSCPISLDDDDDVDSDDLQILLAAYGVDNGGDCDGDCDTDLADLAVLLGDYGCEGE